MKKSIIVVCIVLFVLYLQGCVSQQPLTPQEQYEAALREYAAMEPYAAEQIMSTLEDTETVSDADGKAVGTTNKTDEVAEEVEAEEEPTYDLIIASETGYWWAVESAEVVFVAYDNNIVHINNHNLSSKTYVKASLFQSGLAKEELINNINKLNLDKEKCLFNVLDE